MSGCALCRSHSHFAGMLWKKFCNRIRFNRITHTSRSSMCINIIYRFFCDTCMLNCFFHAEYRTNSFRMRACYVVAVGAVGKSCEFRINLSTAFFRIFFGFNNQCATAFANDKTITVFIKRAARLLRILVIGGQRMCRSQSLNKQWG